MELKNIKIGDIFHVNSINSESYYNITAINSNNINYNYVCINNNEIINSGKCKGERNFLDPFFKRKVGKVPDIYKFSDISIQIGKKKN